ncbi:MAG: DUF1080 domain-containing protein [Mediterranea sp.]|jgi:hypothetical protein|nr:DUF1080 domain-containing protein [Mediterranea sp.]
MERKQVLLISLLCASTMLWAQGQEQTASPRPQQWDPKSTEWHYPVPPKVAPAKAPGAPPADAIVLFNGTDLSQWESADRNNPGPIAWTVRNGELIIAPGKGSIKTKEFFGDCQLHIEFKSPPPGQHDGQNRGNSGIMMQGRYEVQVLDGDNNPTYVNGMVGSIYKQKAPEVNAYTNNGEWQVYDIYWKAPRFGTGGELESPAIVTVVLNGILVQNNYVLKGTTPYTGMPTYTAHGRMPIALQDHGTEVAFRNIWLRNL